MKRLVLAALALGLALAAQPASAQTGTVRGKVVDEKGQAVPEAKVVIDFQGGLKRSFETKSGKKGEFTQVGLPSGMYRFTATKDGYQGTYLDYRVSLGDPVELPPLQLRPMSVAQEKAKQAESLGTQFRRAADLLQAGKLEEGEAAFKALDPSVPEVQYNLGWIAQQRKDWAGAEAFYQKAVEIKPDYGEAWVALARVYQESGQQAKAMEVMTRAAAQNQGDARVQFNLGVFHLNSSQSEQAEAAFRKAVELDPGQAEPYFHLGTLAVGQNKVADAIAHLEKYLSMSPTNAGNVATAQALLSAIKPKK